jgi:ABC-type polysaccharide/polyol phosphate transport system ATPase subunit
MEAVVKNGCTVILVSHDLGAIEILCDTLFYLV